MKLIFIAVIVCGCWWSFSSCLSIKNLMVRNPVKVIRDSVLDKVVIDRIKRRDVVKEHHDVFLTRINHDSYDENIKHRRERRSLHIGDDKEEAAKIRNLIFFGEPRVRKVRQSLDRQKNEILNKLDQSIEDKWKITQSAHSLEGGRRVNVQASKKHITVPLSVMAARVMVPAREESTSLEVSTRSNDGVLQGEEKRDIHLPLAAYRR